MLYWHECARRSEKKFRVPTSRDRLDCDRDYEFESSKGLIVTGVVIAQGHEGEDLKPPSFLRSLMLALNKGLLC